MVKKHIYLTVTWFGAGSAKIIPGTFGTLAALPFAFVVQYFLGNIALALFGCAIFILGCIASETYLKATGKDDPGEIVIDEVAAICILIAFLDPIWQHYLGAFIVFRIFDVLKPWPVSWADRKIKGGFGVMFDDILAALYPVGIYYVYRLITG